MVSTEDPHPASRDSVDQKFLESRSTGADIESKCLKHTKAKMERSFPGGKHQAGGAFDKGNAPLNTIAGGWVLIFCKEFRRGSSFPQGWHSPPLCFSIRKKWEWPKWSILKPRKKNWTKKTTLPSLFQCFKNRLPHWASVSPLGPRLVGLTTPGDRVIWGLGRPSGWGERRWWKRALAPVVWENG